MRSDKANLIVDLSFQFALKVIKYCELLEKEKRFVLATQLLKAGTSIGANVREAQNAESRIDFIHKNKVAAKETDETEYWLLLCKSSDGYPNCDELIIDCQMISRILSKIISTSKTKYKVENK
ncbi:MAG: four helix bundle protein [Candidatus Dadabacteria bacterium]